MLAIQQVMIPLVNSLLPGSFSSLLGFDSRGSELCFCREIFPKDAKVKFSLLRKSVLQPPETVFFSSDLAVSSSIFVGADREENLID